MRRPDPSEYHRFYRRYVTLVPQDALLDPLEGRYLAGIEGDAAPDGGGRA